MASYSTKSSSSGRVITGDVERKASALRNLGNPSMCPAGATVRSVGIYGRRASHATLNNSAAECASIGDPLNSVQGRMQAELVIRPAMLLAAAGSRYLETLVPGDQYLPRNLYGEGPVGFPTNIGLPGGSLPEPYGQCPQVPSHRMRVGDGSHDSTSINRV